MNNFQHSPEFYHDNLLPIEIQAGGHIYGCLEDYTIDYNNNLIAVFDGKEKIHPSDRKYHNSWEWIMPVVRRIYDIGQTINVSCALDITKISIFAPIERVWSAVIEFIKWYNQEKQVL